MKKCKSYQKAIEENFRIVDKDKNEVPFILNRPQVHFLKNSTDRNVILKARKMGFSSVLLAVAVIKFLFGKNERCVSMSFDSGASEKQLERAKQFLRSYDHINGTNVMKALKYNSKSELALEKKDTDGRTYLNTLRIGTAKSSSFGRGDDVSFLHLTEVSSIDNLDMLLAGIGEAVVRNSMVTLETTANGFNGFKTFWDEAALGERGYSAFFYSPKWEYSKEFLDIKKKELGRLYEQEYPSTAESAFLTSGDVYFDRESLKWYLEQIKEENELQALQTVA